MRPTVSHSPAVSASPGDLRSAERRGRETLAERNAKRRGRETLTERNAERRRLETSPNETDSQRKQSGSEGGQDQLCSMPRRGSSWRTLHGVSSHPRVAVFRRLSRPSTACHRRHGEAASK